MIRTLLTPLLLALMVLPAHSTLRNPMFWADVPDPDVIRVGPYYYMVSTTMHLMPGGPIMRSTDFTDWRTVGYLFQRLTDSPRYNLQQGTAYGRGQWATSLRHHQGTFYALFAPNDYPGGDTYILTAKNAAGPWHTHARLPHFHDASLFFDDDGRVYVCYGTGELCELTPDLKGVIPGSHRKLFERDASETGLLEGSRMIKHQGRYYLLMISHVWAPGRHRRQVCYRADNIQGPYEKKVILESDFGGFPHVGQGTIVDGHDGQWYGVIFQDRGAVGRVPTLVPCRWLDGWPILGDAQGRVPQTMPVGNGRKVKSNTAVSSDEFSEPKPHLLWQWNHNPQDDAWSLSERKGWLRLHTCAPTSSLYLAQGTLTQRMEGPRCSGRVKVDFRHMMPGDRCGFAAFNGHSGVLSIRRSEEGFCLQQIEMEVQLDPHDKAVLGTLQQVNAEVPLEAGTVELRIDADFRPGQDWATFRYRASGSAWKAIGCPFKMRFDYRLLFMGTRFALFNYATRHTGGYADFDYFRYRQME